MPCWNRSCHHCIYKKWPGRGQPLWLATTLLSYLYWGWCIRIQAAILSTLGLCFWYRILCMASSSQLCQVAVVSSFVIFFSFFAIIYNRTWIITSLTFVIFLLLFLWLLSLLLFCVSLIVLHYYSCVGIFDNLKKSWKFEKFIYFKSIQAVTKKWIPPWQICPLLDLSSDYFWSFDSLCVLSTHKRTYFLSVLSQISISSVLSTLLIHRCNPSKWVLQEKNVGCPKRQHHGLKATLVLF